MQIETATQPIQIKPVEIPATDNADAPSFESNQAGNELIAAAVTKFTPAQMIMLVLGTIAFFYFARPFVLPVVLACVAGMTLKPLIRWLSQCHIPPALSAALVLGLLVCGVAIGFFELGRPALTWMNEAP